MRSIWAVAKNTVKQALRMKIAAVFIVLLLILLPVMGVSLTGDGTLKGRLQTFVSYGLSLTSFLLCLLTIVVSIYSLSSDIKQRQIYTVITKPIRRFQLVLGKFLGVILLDVFLLLLFSALIYTITISTPKFFDVTESELVRLQSRYSDANETERSKLEVDISKLERELNEIRNEFYTARAGLTAPKLEVTQEEIDEVYNKLERSGQLSEALQTDKAARRQYKTYIAKQIELSKRAAAPGYELAWRFDDVEPIDPKGSLFIRFKYDVAVNPLDETVSGIWRVGNISGIPRKFETYERRDAVRTFQEIEVPAHLVEGGFVEVSFINDPRYNNTVVIFPIEDGLEVLYKADTFTANYVRAVLLILLRLVFLACLGILASTFLSFPVAILLCLCIFFTATMSGFILDSFSYLGANVGGLYRYTIQPVISLLPRFDEFNPTKFLVPARLLSWPLLFRAAGFMVCIKAVVLLLLALLIFSFREIAKVIL
jgi:ABC-type transport system involved in multi-copper enzyme maturation permease subunit